jgi:hypothetical protein
MEWDTRNRKYWDVSHRDKPFWVSKPMCQKFLYALILCDGQLHDTHSVDARNGEVRDNLPPHRIEALFRISLPVGAEETFDRIMGQGWLEEPPKVQVDG